MPMDMISLSLLAGALAAQERSGPLPPLAVDTDAMCIAAISPGRDTMMSISSLLGAEMEERLRRDSLAIAYYLGTLRGRYRDFERIERDIALALTTIGSLGPEARDQRSRRCVAEALDRVLWLERSFPTHRINALIGNRPSGVAKE